MTLRAESDVWGSPDDNGTDCQTITGWGGADTPKIHMVLSNTSSGGSILSNIQCGIGWATNTLDHCIGFGSSNAAVNTVAARIYRDRARTCLVITGRSGTDTTTSTTSRRK